MKLWAIQSILTFDAKLDSVTIRWKAVEQYFAVVLCVFQFYPVCNFGEFINFGLGTVRSERVKQSTRSADTASDNIFHSIIIGAGSYRICIIKHAGILLLR